MQIPYPLWQRVVGVAAVGAGAYGLLGSGYHFGTLVHPPPEEDVSQHRWALLRDLAVLTSSLAGLALLRRSRRFLERPELRMPSVKTFENEVERDLVHVISSPSAEDMARVRRVEDAYYDLNLERWAFYYRYKNAFESPEQGLDQVRRALTQWEWKRGQEDEIGETEALMEVTRLKALMAAHFALAGKVHESEMYEKSVDIHLRVVRQNLQTLRRTREAASETRPTPLQTRILELQKRAEAAIESWCILPAAHLDPAMCVRNLESRRLRAETVIERKPNLQDAQALIDYALAIRDYAFAVRYGQDIEGFISVLQEAEDPMKRGRRILRALESSPSVSG